MRRWRARAVLYGIEHYSNLLLERGENRYGFLHLTLEEMLAAKGIVLLLDEDPAAVQQLFEQYLFDGAWNETLRLTVGVLGVVQQRPKAAARLLRQILQLGATGENTQRQIIFAGEALLDVGKSNVSPRTVTTVIEKLVETMQHADTPIRTRCSAATRADRWGWLPDSGWRRYAAARAG